MSNLLMGIIIIFFSISSTIFWYFEMRDHSDMPMIVVFGMATGISLAGLCFELSKLFVSPAC